MDQIVWLRIRVKHLALLLLIGLFIVAIVPAAHLAAQEGAGANGNGEGPVTDGNPPTPPDESGSVLGDDELAPLQAPPERAAATVKAVTLKSWGGCGSGSLPWNTLNSGWATYGTVPLNVVYNQAGLCAAGDTVTYEKLVASGADVLIFENNSSQFSQAEINAIKQYAVEGHNLLATYQSFQNSTADNRGLAPLFGLRSDLTYGFLSSVDDTYQMVNSADPLFKGITNPYSSNGWPYSLAPTNDSVWDPADLNGAQFLARSTDRKSAITFYAGKDYNAIYVSSMVEYTADYAGKTTDIQFLYNALTYPAVRKAIVVRSPPCDGFSYPAWTDVSSNWMDFGDIPLFIERNHDTLCSSVTYDALAATGADVVIISAAWNGPAYSTAEIAALKKYAEEGHNLLATYFSLFYSVDNKALAPLFGLSDDFTYSYTSVDPTLHKLSDTLFDNLPSSFLSSGHPWSQTPPDNTWDAADLDGASYVAKSSDNKTAATMYEGKNHFAFYVSSMPEERSLDPSNQFLYNILTFEPDLLYLPMLLKDFCGGYSSLSEYEDAVGKENDSRDHANGPICYNRWYTGNPNSDLPGKEEDWYQFHWSGQGQLTVDLEDFIPEEWLILYYESETASLESHFSSTSTYQVTHNGDGRAGTYYVRVFASAGHATGGDYRLRLTVD